MEVIVYRNYRKELIYQILKDHDTTGLIDDIDSASALWISTIKVIYLQMDHNLDELHRLFNEMNVQIGNQRWSVILRKDLNFQQKLKLWKQ